MSHLLLSCAPDRLRAAHTPHAWLVAAASGRVHNDGIGLTGRSAACHQPDWSARPPMNQIRAAVSAPGASAAPGIGGKSAPRRPRSVADTSEAGPRVPTGFGTRDGRDGVRGSRPWSGRQSRRRCGSRARHQAQLSLAESPANTLAVVASLRHQRPRNRARTLGETRMVSCGSSRETRIAVAASVTPDAPLQVHARAQPPPICTVKRSAQAVVEAVDTEAAVAALPVRLPQPPIPVPNGCDGRAAPTAEADPPLIRALT